MGEKRYVEKKNQSNDMYLPATLFFFFYSVSHFHVPFVFVFS